MRQVFLSSLPKSLLSIPPFARALLRAIAPRLSSARDVFRSSDPERKDRILVVQGSKHLLSFYGRNSSAFYWKSVNLIGSPTVFYSPIEKQSRTPSSSNGRFSSLLAVKNNYSMSACWI